MTKQKPLDPEIRDIWKQFKENHGIMNDILKMLNNLQRQINQLSQKKRSKEPRRVKHKRAAYPMYN